MKSQNKDGRQRLDETYLYHVLDRSDDLVEQSEIELRRRIQEEALSGATDLSLLTKVLLYNNHSAASKVRIDRIAGEGEATESYRLSDLSLDFKDREPGGLLDSIRFDVPHMLRNLDCYIPPIVQKVHYLEGRIADIVRDKNSLVYDANSDRWLGQFYIEGYPIYLAYLPEEVYRSKQGDLVRVYCMKGFPSQNEAQRGTDWDEIHLHGLQIFDNNGEVLRQSAALFKGLRFIGADQPKSLKQ